MRDLGRPFEREHAEAGATKVFPCADDVARAARWCVGGLRGTTDLPMSQVVALGRLLEAEVRAAYRALDRDEATPAAPLRFLCRRLAVDAAGHAWAGARRARAGGGGARAGRAGVRRGRAGLSRRRFAARLASAWGAVRDELAAVAREATEAQLADLVDTCAHEEGVWREAAEARPARRRGSGSGRRRVRRPRRYGGGRATCPRTRSRASAMGDCSSARAPRRRGRWRTSSRTRGG